MLLTGGEDPQKYYTTESCKDHVNEEASELVRRPPMGTNLAAATMRGGFEILQCLPDLDAMREGKEAYDGTSLPQAKKIFSDDLQALCEDLVVEGDGSGCVDEEKMKKSATKFYKFFGDKKEAPKRMKVYAKIADAGARLYALGMSGIETTTFCTSMKEMAKKVPELSKQPKGVKKWTENPKVDKLAAAVAKENCQRNEGKQRKGKKRSTFQKNDVEKGDDDSDDEENHDGSESVEESNDESSEVVKKRLKAKASKSKKAKGSDDNGTDEDEKKKKKNKTKKKNASSASADSDDSEEKEKKSKRKGKKAKGKKNKQSSSSSDAKAKKDKKGKENEDDCRKKKQSDAGQDDALEKKKEKAPAPAEEKQAHKLKENEDRDTHNALFASIRLSDLQVFDSLIAKVVADYSQEDVLNELQKGFEDVCPQLLELAGHGGFGETVAAWTELPKKGEVEPTLLSIQNFVRQGIRFREKESGDGACGSA